MAQFYVGKVDVIFDKWWADKGIHLASEVAKGPNKQEVIDSLKLLMKHSFEEGMTIAVATLQDYMNEELAKLNRLHTN